jgi:hypothetical protein
MIPSRKLAECQNIVFTPSAQPVQGGIQMRSRIWIVIAAAALVVGGVFAAISIKKQREGVEAERMMVWG